MKKEEMERIYDKLDKIGEIGHGNLIERETLRLLFNVDSFDSWKYLNPLLELKKYLETEKGMYCAVPDGNLYIEEADEAAYCSKKRRQRADNIDKRNKQTLEKLDYRVMSSTARAEAMLEKRLLEMKLRNSRLIMREIEYYEVPEDEED